jgi:hypothetical protein
MRVRLGDQLAAAIHARAVREGRSFQVTHDRVLEAGLRSLGAVHATVGDEASQPNDSRETYRLTLRLPVALYGPIKSLAKAERRSGRAMICALLEAGLKTFPAP